MYTLADAQRVFKANRPTLSDGSLRTYSSIIVNLGKQLDFPSVEPAFLAKHAAEISGHFQHLLPKNRKTRLSALVVYLDKQKGTEDAVAIFRRLMMDDSKKADEESKSQVMNEKQKEGMIPWATVLEKYEELKAEVAPLWKKEKLDKRQFHKLQLFVLLSCLVLIPPRRSQDWTEFKIREVDPAKDNHLMIETVGRGKAKKNTAMLVFNVYKTAKVLGQQKEVIPDELTQILKAWYTVNPHEYLLMNIGQTGKVNQSQLAVWLKEFFGTPTSTSMLRHSFLSEKYANVPALKEMEATAASMGQKDITTALSYVKK